MSDACCSCGDTAVGMGDVVRPLILREPQDERWGCGSTAGRRKRSFGVGLRNFLLFFLPGRIRANNADSFSHRIKGRCPSIGLRRGGSSASILVYFYTNVSSPHIVLVYHCPATIGARIC